MVLARAMDMPISYFFMPPDDHGEGVGYVLELQETGTRHDLDMEDLLHYLYPDEDDLLSDYFVHRFREAIALYDSRAELQSAGTLYREAPEQLERTLATLQSLCKELERSLALAKKNSVAAND